MRNLAVKAVKAVLNPLGLELRPTDVRHFAEATGRERDLIKQFKGYSMTPPFRQWTFLRALEYVERSQIEGDIVECGVWRGGNIMLAKAYVSSERRYWLYDTFAGMSEPTEHDVSSDGRAATRIHAAPQKQQHNTWGFASLKEVQDNFQRHGLLDETVIFRRGKVEETLESEPLPERIAVLRLDTDWYESTLVELKRLYPLLAPGGVLILDDYGSWLGSKRAVDEYFGGRAPLLVPVDCASRMAVKI